MISNPTADDYIDQLTTLGARKSAEYVNEAAKIHTSQPFNLWNDTRFERSIDYYDVKSQEIWTSLSDFAIHWMRSTTIDQDLMHLCYLDIIRLCSDQIDEKFFYVMNFLAEKEYQVDIVKMTMRLVLEDLKRNIRRVEIGMSSIPTGSINTGNIINANHISGHINQTFTGDSSTKYQYNEIILNALINEALPLTVNSEEPEVIWLRAELISLKREIQNSEPDKKVIDSIIETSKRIFESTTANILTDGLHAVLSSVF